MWANSAVRHGLGLTRSVDRHLCSVEKMELGGVRPVHRAIPIEPPIHYTMQIKHRTLIQAAVLLIVLVFGRKVAHEKSENVQPQGSDPTHFGTWL